MHDLRLREQFGHNLKGARRRGGFSQEELASLDSLQRTEIGMLERGIRAPRLDTIIKLAGGLEVEPGELLSGMRWTIGSRISGSFTVDGSPQPRPKHRRWRPEDAP